MPSPFFGQQCVVVVQSSSTLELMQTSFTIVDSFDVSGKLGGVTGLAKGRWFVLEGQFTNAEALPSAGVPVWIRIPTGLLYSARIAAVEVRHGSAAVMVGESELSEIPRLSVVSLLEA